MKALSRHLVQLPKLFNRILNSAGISTLHCSRHELMYLSFINPLYRFYWVHLGVDITNLVNVKILITSPSIKLPSKRKKLSTAIIPPNIALTGLNSSKVLLNLKNENSKNFEKKYFTLINIFSVSSGIFESKGRLKCSKNSLNTKELK
ncbi:hypothetical protein BpHYR1_003615 [Brachionus plicatilis]|uniref:Uncharacterized protein n=1 Tax=Brachionus plicatilis TaxID=10195 RepID=A0A3M7P854_BRAPC|nr:hypothetical protein BpHYR1_003615 [Brachionus plicatilis]